MTVRANVKIELRPLGLVLEVRRGTPLKSLLHAYGLEFPCGGQGLCSGCRVKVVSGQLEAGEDQAEILSREELAEGWRAACRCRADDDVVLEVGQWETVILADHSSFAFEPRAGRGVVVDLGTTTIVAQLVDLGSGRVLGVHSVVNPQTKYGSDVMSRIQAALGDPDIALAGAAGGCSTASAATVGTTARGATARGGASRRRATQADEFSAAMAASAAARKPAPGAQAAAMAADLAGVEAAAAGGDAQAPDDLTAELRRELAVIVAKVVRGAGGEPAESVVVCGNTVMHHLFCGLDLRPLSVAPFETVHGGPHSFTAAELGWSLPGDPPVRFLPCLGSFVGSDLLCGVLALRMHESEQPMILIDLGTNGEIVLGNRDRILCASTAAGPAFEAGRIAMGMRATTGAIDRVWVEDGKLVCTVIGGGPPRGICGSGLVDAVAAGLDLGSIQASGRLSRRGRPLEISGSVALRQDDIRQLQLAKGAIAAGIAILRSRFGEDRCEGAPVYLAGAFGNYVNRRSAQRIGLLGETVGTVSPAGNTALLGAKIAMFAAGKAAAGIDFEQIRSRVEHVPLATDPRFQDIYIDEMAFPGWQAG